MVRFFAFEYSAQRIRQVGPTRQARSTPAELPDRGCNLSNESLEHGAAVIRQTQRGPPGWDQLWMGLPKEAEHSEK